MVNSEWKTRGIGLVILWLGHGSHAFAVVTG